MCREVRTVGQLSPTVGTARAPWVVGFHQTRTGHYLQLRRPDRATGVPTVIFGTLDATRLTAQAVELLGQHALAPT